MNLIAKAEIFARGAHAGQVDKVGVDYTEHLKAVAEMCEHEDEKVVAWLHDVIEDTPVGPHDLLNAGFPKHIVDAVLLLTHTHELSHEQYIIRIRDAKGYVGFLAQTVKRKDMKHNTRGDLPWLRERYEKGIAILDGTTED